MLEQGFARTSTQIEQMQEDITHIGEATTQILERLTQIMVQAATCATRQEEKWVAHDHAHGGLQGDLNRVAELQQRDAENIRILSATVSRLAEKQRT